MGKILKVAQIIAIVFFCIISILVIAGICIMIFPPHKYFSISQDISQIESIKIQCWDVVNDEENTLVVIPQDKHEAFVNDLSKIVMTYYTPPVTTIEGPYFTIQYKNGEYEDIGGWATYISGNKYVAGNYDFDLEQFIELLEKYGYEDSSSESSKYE